MSALRILLCLLYGLTTQTFGSEPFEYSLLKHKVFIESVRAGNHDEKGENTYYFTYEISAVSNSEKDSGKEIKDRKMIHDEPVEFGEVEVKALQSWKDGETNENALFFEMEGDTIRELVSRAMREFGVKEHEVGVFVKIKVFERGKWLYFFGEDTFIEEKEYFPLPISEYQVASRTNLKLTIEDELGATMRMKVRYQHPVETSEIKKRANAH